ncbi:hypothetical protein [Mycoplasma bradburyae]|uniref:Uncharacterized protein n=2 Tax=Mycoplasma bradburyae TaxID=2963128 RepID=A0ABT5GCH8_9MOLU|nr:hypothetical protein [Mycoplasma bradburyae]MDC4182175.1 hypothetical protein [Mycoplasma bradburyae]UTS70256.1 hypothetical protein NMG68_00680 [Mycoplasma bradburyae]
MLEVFLKKHNQEDFKPYKDLKPILKSLKNFKPKKYKNSWFYQRHHVDEIYCSGAILKEDQNLYDNGLCLIVNIEEHAFLHYLIVMSQTTIPNYGMLLQISLQQWDSINKKYCEKYNIPYIKNWPEYLRGLEFEE